VAICFRAASAGTVSAVTALVRTTDVTTALAALRDDGCVIVEDVLTPREIRDLSDAVSTLEAGHPLGRNTFEGERSHRLYSLIAKGPPFVALAQHDLALAVLDATLQPGWLLSNCQSIRLYPGETRQPWHTDDGFYPIPRPRTFPLAMSSIWALDPFTSANGATELLVGSHRWGSERPDDVAPLDVVGAEMSPGSVVWFDAALWHRGGANTTAGTRLCMTVQYCQPWLRPQESQLLIAPPDIARGLPDRVRAMLGYSIHPPFIGQVEGKHPLRLVDEDAYRRSRGDDSEVAERILVRPEAVSVPDSS
jgi:ectoine hydroxylase-related dioxygenase (phytanoyl-CoA dioxygenase family)